MEIPKFTDKKYWDNLIYEYIQDKNKFVTFIDIEDRFWNYFKYCLKTNNRYYFNHPLIPLLESIFLEHICVLKKGTNIYRARNDDDNHLWKEWLIYSSMKATPKTIERIKKHNVDEKIVKGLCKKYEIDSNSKEFNEIKTRIESGFQGFDAKGSSAPPPTKASEGRCNLNGVSYLYAALDEHTAIAEIRPHIKDKISVALLKPVRDLKLVNLDFDPNKVVCGEDFLFNNIQHDFSLIHKKQHGDYLITQYITSLIEHLGYDGLCFRSSLTTNGTNYVIFNPDNCSVQSSKLFLLSNVKYVYGQCK